MNDAQIDGFACVKCGTEKAVMVPAGFGPRGQLFECAEECTPVFSSQAGLASFRGVR